MYSITNINIFVNSKPPSPAYGHDGSFSEVDNALLFMCYAYYSDFWPSIFFNELRFLGICCSRLVEWLVVLVFFFSFFTFIFQGAMLFTSINYKRVQIRIKVLKKSWIMVKIVNFFKYVFFFDILKLY